MYFIVYYIQLLTLIPTVHIARKLPYLSAAADAGCTNPYPISLSFRSFRIIMQNIRKSVVF